MTGFVYGNTIFLGKYIVICTIFAEKYILLSYF